MCYELKSRDVQVGVLWKTEEIKLLGKFDVYGSVSLQ
jgi:hypothetical protein